MYAGELPRDTRQLVIGLNPPFGTRNQLADKFTEHAASFNPRMIILIVPPATKVTCSPECLPFMRQHYLGAHHTPLAQCMPLT